MSNVAEKIASIGPEDVTEQELGAFDSLLNRLADDMADDRREGDLIEFLTELSETLRRGVRVTLYATKGSHT